MEVGHIMASTIVTQLKYYLRNFNKFLKKDFNNKTYVQTNAFEQVNSNVSPYRVTYFGLTYKFGRLKENVSRKTGINNDDLL